MRYKSLTTQTTEIAYTQAGSSVSLDGAIGFSVSHEAEVTTPSATVFTANVSDVLTAADHGFVTGLKGQCSSTTTLPAGLSAATDYFVIVVSSGTFKLASSLVNAQAGTAIDITDTGTGTHTFTPTSLAGASVKLQATNDLDDTSAVWYDISGTSNNITTTANFYVLEKVEPMYRKVRAYHTMTAGQLSLVTKFLLKQN